MERRTYALRLAYDGAPFRGWQRQPGLPTVQEEVERALAAHLGRALLLFGASRTDAGVHADGQVAHFHARLPVEVPALIDGLSRNFPPGLAIKAAAEASSSFHARSSSIGKRYRYRFSWGEAQPARSFWLGSKAQPRWERARAALAGLDGLAEISGLASPSRDRKSAPPLQSVGWEESAGEAVFEVRAEAFRKHQIRNLAGHLAAVALGLAEPESLRALASLRRPWRGATAPPHGLTLLEVLYPRDLDPFLSPAGQNGVGETAEARAITSAATSR